MATASYSTDVDMMLHNSGLDAALLIRFTVMAMEIMLGIGVPNMLILSMVYCWFGGKRADGDHLSYLGIGNVDAETHSWIYGLVAVMVWYNVIFIQQRLFEWQRYFITLRKKWLLSLPAHRHNTVMVQGIPHEYCSDEALQKYFQMLYGESEVLHAAVVKDIRNLRGVIEEYKTTELELHKVEHFMRQNPDLPSPTWSFMSGGESKVDYYHRKLTQLEEAIKNEQRAVKEEAAKSPFDSSIYSTNGFVSFKTLRVAKETLFTRIQSDHTTFIMSIPPDPSDIIWEDLEKPWRGDIMQFIGWCLIVGLFLAFMPIVFFISRIAKDSAKVPFMKKALAEGGFLEPYKSTIDGQLASLGLTFMMSMLPTFLMQIIKSCWLLNTNLLAQSELQKSYYWFLVAFVLLALPIQGSVTEFVHDAFDSPSMLLERIGRQMPPTSHFYMNFVVMQWTVHALTVTRHIQFLKFLVMKRFCDAERARVLSEPEDQDYYGIGSRSARFCIMFNIGIVFGTMSPLLCFLVFINFFACRGVYCYLMNFAEQRKTDLGGVFWDRQLIHCHVGVFLYILVMIGILFELRATEASTRIPCIVAAGSLVRFAFAIHRHLQLFWTTLPFEDVVTVIASGDIVAEWTDWTPTEHNYFQPELDEDFIEKYR